MKNEKTHMQIKETADTKHWLSAGLNIRLDVSKGKILNNLLLVLLLEDPIQVLLLAGVID